MDLFDRWLEAHADTDVVRFTTFAYLFTLDSNKQGLDRYRDWLGYTDTISIPALEDFAREYGYRLRSEDIVDQGYYNNTARVPSQAYRDWMEFIQRFVIEFSRELTDRVHRAGKRTAMFQGDHWIGTEPFSPGYQKLGIDINIGAVEDGVALRRLSDSPGKQLREARFYPYFFPDVFREGGDPLGESLRNWVKIRRALLREPIDRIGYGGYLSLATKFPDFVEHVAAICGDFRELLRRTGKERSRRMPVKVMVLNAWGELRAWLQNACIDQKFHVPSRPDVMEFVGSNPLECLAGLPLEVIFRSFADGLRSDYRGTLQLFIALEAFGSDHAKDDIRSLRGELFARGEPSAESLAAGLELLETSDLRDELRTLAAPSLWIAGKRDRLVDPRAMQAAAALAPDASVHVIEHAGHAPFLTHADEVAALLAEFAPQPRPWKTPPPHAGEGGERAARTGEGT